MRTLPSHMQSESHVRTSSSTGEPSDWTYPRFCIAFVAEHGDIVKFAYERPIEQRREGRNLARVSYKDLRLGILARAEIEAGVTIVKSTFHVWSSARAVSYRDFRRIVSEIVREVRQSDEEHKRRPFLRLQAVYQHRSAHGDDAIGPSEGSALTNPKGQVRTRQPSRPLIPNGLGDPSDWPRVPGCAFSNVKENRTCLRRQLAVVPYARDESFEKIHRDMGIDKSSVIRFVKSCLRTSKGLTLGFFALISRCRREALERTGVVAWHRP
jgi:hypothetical protein